MLDFTSVGAQLVKPVAKALQQAVVLLFVDFCGLFLRAALY